MAAVLLGDRETAISHAGIIPGEFENATDFRQTVVRHSKADDLCVIKERGQRIDAVA